MTNIYNRRYPGSLLSYDSNFALREVGADKCMTRFAANVDNYGTQALANTGELIPTQKMKYGVLEA